MKRYLLALLTVLAPAACAQTAVSLAWDYEPAVITNAVHDPVTGAVTGTSLTTNWPTTFIVRGNRQASAPLTTWPVIANVVAMQTNASTGVYAVRTNYTVSVAAGSYFFVLTASNEGGDSPFSNVALRRGAPKEGSGLSAAKP